MTCYDFCDELSSYLYHKFLPSSKRQRRRRGDIADAVTDALQDSMDDLLDGLRDLLQIEAERSASVICGCAGGFSAKATLPAVYAARNQAEMTSYSTTARPHSPFP